MQLGCVPAAWTLSHVTPIFKKGSPADPLNYRPISLTAVCSKLFEAGIKLHLLEYVTDLGVLTPDQHGFLAGRSTCSNLIESFDGWTRNLDLKSDTLVANIDFAKAFDSVSVPKLIYKLSRFGIKGKLADCISTLLTARQQRVKVGTCLSGTRTLRSGVPQGSVLGPILFVLFINDIVSVLPPKMCSKIFADDLKAFICVDSPLDVNTFKHALRCLDLWAETWQLPISSAKSNWMRISNKCASGDIAYDFTLCNVAIPELPEVKDLGVIFDNKLSFDSQITSVISRSKQQLFLLRRSFVTKDPCILVLAFKTYILPLLDYCSPIWAPSHITDIRRLESVQRLFTKRLLGYELLDYPHRLAKAGLCGLELRRMCADLTLCYKILHGHVKVGPLLCLDPSTTTRGHGWKLKPTTPRLDSRLHFFAYRVCKWWNVLRADTVNAKSVAGFKALLLTEDLTSFLLNPL
jgi:Reverse transcriptase (RNA-dependent DNA polymerase)